MHKWTKSACVVLAWCILPVLMAAGMTGSIRSAQANHRIATSITQVTLASSVGVSTPRATAPKAAATARYVVQPGAILVTPRPAASAPARVPPAPRSGHNHQQPIPAQPHVPAAANAQSPRAGHLPLPIVTRPAATRLPRWLQALLLAAGLLIAVAFLTESAMMLGRRRHRARPARGAREATDAAEKARIVLADHERLIVTYSTADDTVYVLTPPGEDPRAVLRAARLILPDDTYEVLAGHLGVPANWPLE